MNFTHCTECGSLLIQKELEHEGIIPYCPVCKEYRFHMFNVAVSMIVTNEENGKILLVKQYGRPTYILVAGYVNRGESLEETAIRELREETGMNVERLEYNRSQFFEPSNTLMCNYTVFVKNDEDLHVNREIDSFQWFTPKEACENIRKGSLAEQFLMAYLKESQL